MAKARFYHVYIVCRRGVRLSTVEKKMDLAIDWFRYDKKNYIVYSTSETDKLQRRLQPLVSPDGNLFICELNVNNHNGWMTQNFWDWLTELR